MKLTLKTKITNSHITTFQYRKQDIGKKLHPLCTPPQSPLFPAAKLQIKGIEWKVGTGEEKGAGK